MPGTGGIQHQVRLHSLFGTRCLLAKSSCEKKKKSTSQLRREKKRKEERKNKKEDTGKVSENLDPESPIFRCDHCEATFKSEKGLKIHVGKSHKTNYSSTPEKERRSSPEKELLLNLTPARESREELNNWGSDNFEVQCDLCDKLLFQKKS